MGETAKSVVSDVSTISNSTKDDVALIGAFIPAVTAFFTAINTTITASSKASVEVGESKGKFSLLMAQERHKQETELLKADPAYAKSRMDQRYELEVSGQKFDQDSEAIQQKFENELTKADFEFTKQVVTSSGSYLKDLTEKILPIAAMRIQQVAEHDGIRHEREEKAAIASELRAKAEETRRQEAHAVELARDQVRLREETARANERELEAKVRILKLNKELAELEKGSKADSSMPFVAPQDSIKESFKSR